MAQTRVARTRTAPAEDATRSVKFAVICCQDYAGKYFHVLRHAAEQDVDFVLHLGDYIYETAGDPSFQSPTDDRNVAFSAPEEALGVNTRAELADAEARVLLGRRFHNDAVRDTLALRERPVVRLLRLGGRAPLPTYFEIAGRPSQIGPDAHDASLADLRTSARVVLLDEQDRVRKHMRIFIGREETRDVRRPMQAGEELLIFGALSGG